MRSPSLQQYQSMRDFTKTREPRSRVDTRAKRQKPPVFVIQKHQARRLHWDFRLEWEGVLKSWAVTREPSMDPTVRRFAVQVEDHPYAYKDFEGEIPRGEYGAGHVEIWDHGIYVPPKDFDQALDRGHLTVTLRGRRLKGDFTLQRLPDADGSQWLLLKKKQDQARHRDELHLSLDGHLVALSRLSKVWYPETGTTKRAVLNYYRKIAPVLLPHLEERPVTLKRYPDGVTGEFFYEKRCPSHRPPWMKTVRLKEIDFCRVDTLSSLLWAVNLGSLELHPYLSCGGAMDRPRSMVFDLDPGPGCGLLDCARLALVVREELVERGLRSWVKTSGSKGLQLYVPLNPPASSRLTFADTKACSRAIAERLERRMPGLVVSKMARNLRQDRILIDWSQNDRAKTTVAAYSLRATPAPQVSTPVDWREIQAALRARDPERLTFSPDEVLERVAKHGDLFKPILTLRQEL